MALGIEPSVSNFQLILRCAPLMPIFKYFTDESHARALMRQGRMLFRPLSYFRSYEDEQIRGDRGDAILVYSPEPGLEITKQDGTKLTLTGWRFTSSPKDDDVFAFCTSVEKSSELAERFQSPFCVEIAKPDELLKRLKARAHSKSELDYEQLMSGPVEYRTPHAQPGADWALPDKLTLIKPAAFSWQKEFRVAVGKRGAFDVQNVDCKLERGPSSSSAAQIADHSIILRIGALTEVTTLHRF